MIDLFDSHTTWFAVLLGFGGVTGRTIASVFIFDFVRAAWKSVSLVQVSVATISPLIKDFLKASAIPL